MNALKSLIRANRAGTALALPAVCSAHPDVITASLLLARDRNRTFLIEATSNQVNQFGGYTGMQPAGFIAFVHGLCDENSVERSQVIFGGDHLGPQVWKDQDASTAMAHADTLMQAYVRAGFTKIHLDCSEGCKGEATQVGDAISAGRAARLAAICEEAAPNPSALSYVIGTEVPPPGGARADEEGQAVVPTTPAHAVRTLELHQAAFDALNLDDAWSRVVALVVQPGLEFAPDHVDHYQLGVPDELTQALADYPDLCFEAHSTDYQLPEVYPELARRHFAILKVGPALTFAYRQAIYSLDHIRNWLEPDGNHTPLCEQMETLMTASPAHWQKHYSGDAARLRLLRHFGYADRIRYYWTQERALRTTAGLEAYLSRRALSAPLLEQYFAPEILARSEALKSSGFPAPKAIILAQIQTALEPYFFGD